MNTTEKVLVSTVLVLSTLCSKGQETVEKQKTDIEATFAFPATPHDIADNNEAERDLLPMTQNILTDSIIHWYNWVVQERSSHYNELHIQYEQSGTGNRESTEQVYWNIFARGEEFMNRYVNDKKLSEHQLYKRIRLLSKKEKEIFKREKRIPANNSTLKK